MIAGRYLRARRQEGFISVIAIFSFLGITLGVATLIIVMAVMNGFRHELLGRILGLNGHIMVQARTGELNDYDAILARIKSTDGVVSVTPIVEGQVMATAQKTASGAMVRGIRAADLAALKVVADNIVAGDLADFQIAKHVVIGDRLARKLGLAVGGKITLISPKGTATAFGFVPRIATYRIAATFHIGMYEYDSTFVFLPLKQARKMKYKKNHLNQKFKYSKKIKKRQ